MFRNYLKSAYRNLSKHKAYTFINIIGLSVGLASCLLIANFLNNELSFDLFHKESHNIYRINHLMADNTGAITKMANTPPALVPGIRSNFPEIKKATQLRYIRRTLLEYDDRRFIENHGFYADSLFLEIFSFPLIIGDSNTALDQPNSVVITKNMASKYFGNDNPIGKILTMNGDINLQVTGVLESIPANSHLQFDYLVSFSTYIIPDGYLSDLTSWSWAGFLSYVIMKDGADPKALQDKIDQLYRDIYPGSTYPNRANVQSFENIYLESADLVDDLASGLQAGNKLTIYVLGIVAILILLIASFNFMNLSIAISVSRGKEVGVRKILGADKSSLVFQLLTESVILSVISLIIAYLLSMFIPQHFNDFLKWNWSFNWKLVMYSLPFAIVVTFLVGILAGLYPALILSGNKAVLVVMNYVKNSVSTGSTLRKTLIAFQFFISISLITSTIVITKQFLFLSDQNLGFDKENVVVIKLLPQDMSRHYDTFKERLLQNNHILSVSRSQRSMGEPWPINMIKIDGSDHSEYKSIVGNQVGYGYPETMGMKLLEGRTFSKEYSNDVNKSIIVNQKTVEYLGLDDPIGKKVQYFSFDGPRTIIGVVEDFNFLSLHYDITPMVLVLPFVDIQYLFVRITPGNITDKIATIQDIWENTNPGVPLEHRFMDDQLNQLYDNEKKLSYLISGFSGLAIMLACMGLYGLIAFSLNRSKKEIGIRKVLGASISSLLIRFSREYLYLIGLTSLIAIPVIHYFLNFWLEDFAYRIEIPWWIYILSVLVLTIIALITMSHQAISASFVNPVTVLKDE